jgi:hypothetical protein
VNNLDKPAKVKLKLILTTKVIEFVWLKPETFGEFSAHGDIHSVSTKVKEFLVKKGGISNFSCGTRIYKLSQR